MLYTQAQHQQRVSFKAGEKQALARVHEFVLRESGGAAYLAVESICNFLQMECQRTEEPGLGTNVQGFILTSSLPTSHSPSTTSGSQGCGLEPSDVPKDLHLRRPIQAVADQRSCYLASARTCDGTQHGYSAGKAQAGDGGRQGASTFTEEQAQQTNTDFEMGGR